MAKYFTGERCNPDWQVMESEAAKRLRGAGWPTFIRKVRAERGNCCELCGVPHGKSQQTELHVHHILKVCTHRHLRFERSNVIVLCEPCHKKHENAKASELALLRLKCPSVVDGTLTPATDEAGERSDWLFGKPLLQR